MRILHLIHRTWPYHGGAERYVLEHALAGVRRGHETVICSTDAWDMSWLVSRKGRHLESLRDTWKGIEIYRTRVVHPPMQDLARAFLRRILPCGEDRFYYPNPFVPGLKKMLGSMPDFDLIHAGAMPFMLFNGYYQSRRTGAALVSVPHANVGEKFRMADALSYFAGCQPRIFRESTFTVAQSPFEKELFNELGVPDERVLVLGSGVDPQEFSGADPERGRASLGIEGPFILCLTAHSADRGTGHLIEACRELEISGRDLTLVLAGPVMPDAEVFLQEAAREGFLSHGRIVVTGPVSQEERIDLIAAADIVVLPSRLDCFGIILLEGWLCGKPVIGCWSGAMPDLIEDGVNGLLASWGDIPALSRAIAQLLDRPELRRSMGDAGRRKVLVGHTWEKVTDRFYRRVAEVIPPTGQIR